MKRVTYGVPWEYLAWMSETDVDNPENCDTGIVFAKTRIEAGAEARKAIDVSELGTVADVDRLIIDVRPWKRD